MKKRLLRAAMILMTVILLPFSAAVTEGTILPPSPEPPAANGAGRPTPAPTALPEVILIDHVNLPDEYPDFEFRKDRKLLDIWIPNIKDADMAVLAYDGQIWMLDCGDVKSARRGVKMLQQLGITKIDTLLNSHMHHDHIDGLTLVNEAAKVGEIRICFPPDLTQSGLLMIQAAEEHGIPVKEYKDGDRFALGDGAVEMQILKNNEEELDINNQSAVTKITYGKRSILFTADLEWLGQEAMIKRLGDDAGVLKSDILKYPHHGKTALEEEFLRAVNPEAAIITNKTVADWGGVRYLAAKGIPYIYTNQTGVYLHLVTDGEHWIAEQVPQDRVGKIR